MRLRHQLVVAATLALGALGCAGARSQQSSAGYVTVCNDDAVTGSRIGRVRCQRQYDVDERSRRDRAFMQRLQNETPRRKITPPDERIVSNLRQSGNMAASYGENQQR